ncbi:hypothetical protein IN842_15665 [Mycobacteroides abscessus subsp. abscessus]|uniref:hypothetical protein n=1 Tax=Mycobacteroides TaxID=670516 RepID=UPI000A47188C|nr:MULTISPECIES: hypothetical protein [Mycobacteroides]QSM41752.1 hypothetical protein IN842_15665 [Mycobacteroides abscessus subsp. abscessus]
MADPSVVAPIITATGSLVVSLVALGGVWWNSRQTDARERSTRRYAAELDRERHRLDQLTAAVGELLGHAANARRLTVILGHRMVTAQNSNEPEAVQALTELTAFTAAVSAARFKVELIEPRLGEASGKVVEWCQAMSDAAMREQHDDALTRRQDEVTRALMDAYRRVI